MRRVLFVWVMLLSSTGLMAQDPVTYGGAVRGPLWSTPGWFGPGPVFPRHYPGTNLDWQYYGVAGGPRLGYGGPFWNGWWWGPPGAAGSFWTNGLSLYGPPVPTYTPTPGVFGGADGQKTFFRNPPPANGVFVGLGWGGYRSPSPRGVPPTVSVFPPSSVSIIQTAPVQTSTGEPCLRLVVRVPDENAEVWIDNKPTAQRGVERHFDSPALAPGQRYQYELVARWISNGQERAESRTIQGEPGQTIAVDFRLPKD